MMILDHPMSIACSIGIMAYDEEANIGRMLAAVGLTAVFHDTSLNFPLKDGDVLSVPQLPRWNDLDAAVSVSMI